MNRKEKRRRKSYKFVAIVKEEKAMRIITSKNQ